MMRVVAAAVLALTTMVSGTAAPASPAALAALTATATSLEAGAATVDITPPAVGSGNAVGGSGCTAVDGSGPYDGPLHFAVEEPYDDTNGNGHYDAPDPTTGTSGEPFLDCPTPTATGDTRSPDQRWDGIYLGGGDCCDRLASGKVFDRLEADALVVARGSRRIAVVTVDNEGIFKEIWDEVRAKVAADGVHLDAVFPSSTHDESAPDTIGITGPTQTTSGVDPFYVEFLVARVATAVEQAAAHVAPVRIRYGSAHPRNLIPCWSSYPFVADEQIGAMQAVTRSGRVVATLVDYGIHAEELGFAPKTRHDISGDWWHFLRTRIRNRYGDRPVLAMAGAVGSVEMPVILRGPAERVPSGVHTYSSLDGCTTIYAGPAQRVRHEGGYSTYTRTLGHVVAHWAVRALRDGAWSRSNQLRFALRTIYAPVTNALFLAAGPACVFDYRILYTNHVPTGSGEPPGCGGGDEIATDVGWFRIGSGAFVMAPGELFPSTYLHDFHGRSGHAAPSAGPVHGWVMARLGGRWRFVDGLGGDLSGYIFPANNEVGTPTASNPDPSNVDRFGCHHVDDGEASSGSEGDVVDDALLSLLPRSGRDQVRTGRYVDGRGRLYRDPLGRGILGCDKTTSGFTPAPDGSSVGIVVMPHHESTFRRGSARIVHVGRHGVRWMDLSGLPQRRPSEQTRGVILRDGTRVWLDVYPQKR